MTETTEANSTADYPPSLALAWAAHEAAILSRFGADENVRRVMKGCFYSGVMFAFGAAAEMASGDSPTEQAEARIEAIVREVRRYRDQLQAEAAGVPTAG